MEGVFYFRSIELSPPTSHYSRDMNRILAIDYGAKRVGLAWTDGLRISINPLDTVRTELFDERLDELLLSDEITQVVFGLPKHKDGNLTRVGEDVLGKIAKFEKKFTNISFTTIDESFTSQRARQMMVHLGTKKKQRERKENIDQMSAVIILKDFIDTL